MADLNNTSERRGFLRRLASLTGAGAVALPLVAKTAPKVGAATLPAYARAMTHKSLKQSSFDRTGGNADSWRIAPGATQVLLESEGPGVVTHLWATIASKSPQHLKEIVLRIYWDGNPKPSVEVPVGDFYGLNLGQYFVYQSAFLNCSSVKALNCYFAMPFRKSARITATNEGALPVQAFYSNIDYQRVAELPADASYFHAQYRQAKPNTAVEFPKGEKELNLNGEKNYVFAQARGQGHLMGVTLGVVQNADHWMGEGDEMIFVDDDARPIITGTGSEDYFCGAWDFGGTTGATPFAHLYNGAPFIATPEKTGGKYCLYRWHGDNPVTFTRSLKHTIEHGHANDRADNFYSVCYWYQSEPFTDFPPLPAVGERTV